MNLFARFVGMNRRAAAWLEGRFPEAFRDDSYVDALMGRVNEAIVATRPARILEAGGVDRPLLQRNQGYEFVGVDIDDRPECADVYDRFIVQSVEEPMPVQADMIVSITLLEHVPDNKSAIESFFRSLNPGGTTHHYIPSKWHPYSISLRLVGPKLQKILIKLLRPGAIGVTGYPAFFDYCDPGSMEKLMERSGFVNIRTKTFYEAADYFAFFLPAYLLVVAIEKLCKALNLRIFASGFVISASKPA